MPASAGVINYSFSNLSRLQRCNCDGDVDQKKNVQDFSDKKSFYQSC